MLLMLWYIPLYKCYTFSLFVCYAPFRGAIPAGASTVAQNKRWGREAVNTCRVAFKYIPTRRASRGCCLLYFNTLICYVIILLLLLLLLYICYTSFGHTLDMFWTNPSFAATWDCRGILRMKTKNLMRSTNNPVYTSETTHLHIKWCRSANVFPMAFSI